MKSAEQIGKIKAVVLYILQHFKYGVDYIKLFKIMYFAQREYLATYGLTMIEDTFKARPHGPVPALTYKVVKMAEEGSPEKSDLSPFISALRVDDNQMIYGVETPDMDFIAEMEKSELDSVIEKYADIDSDALSELSHDSAYKKVVRLMKDDPQKDVMTLIDIARAGGATNEMVSHIREVQLVKAALAS